MWKRGNKQKMKKKIIIIITIISISLISTAFTDKEIDTYNKKYLKEVIKVKKPPKEHYSQKKSKNKTFKNEIDLKSYYPQKIKNLVKDFLNEFKKDKDEEKIIIEKIIIKKIKSTKNKKRHKTKNKKFIKIDKGLNKIIKQNRLKRSK